MQDPLGHRATAKLLALIETQAQNGAPAFSNEGYAEAIGVHTSVITDSLARLRRAGLIETETKTHHTRRIYVTALREWTEESLRANASTRSKRRCMCCRGIFESEGSHNRICGPCKHRDGPPHESLRLPASASVRLSNSWRQQLNASFRCASAARSASVSKAREPQQGARIDAAP